MPTSACTNPSASGDTSRLVRMADFSEPVGGSSSRNLTRRPLSLTNEPSSLWTKNFSLGIAVNCSGPWRVQAECLGRVCLQIWTKPTRALHNRAPVCHCQRAGWSEVGAVPPPEDLVALFALMVVPLGLWLIRVPEDFIGCRASTASCSSLMACRTAETLNWRRRLNVIISAQSKGRGGCSFLLPCSLPTPAQFQICPLELHE